MPAIIIYLLWIASEIYLAVSKTFRARRAEEKDRSSFRYIWITLVISLSLGIWLGISGIGFISWHPTWLMNTGLVLILLGLILRWWAILTLRNLFTVKVSILRDHHLIQHGPFRFLRHPSYTGSLFSFLGLGLSFANWLSTIIIFLPILSSFIYRIRVEEQALQEAFGDEYSAYCRRVPYRLFPFIY